MNICKFPDLISSFDYNFVINGQIFSFYSSIDSLFHNESNDIKTFIILHFLNSIYYYFFQLEPDLSSQFPLERQQQHRNSLWKHRNRHYLKIKARRVARSSAFIEGIKTKGDVPNNEQQLDLGLANQGGY